MPILEAGPVVAVVDPDDGCRLSSLILDGVELLGHDEDFPGALESPFHHGCFPMAPFAGRVRHGRFSFEGQAHRLPINFEDHAIHGMVADRPWAPTSTPGEWRVVLDDRWPFAGHVVQRFDLDADRLRVELVVHADDPDVGMPVTAGWHPWFRKVLDGYSEPATLTFHAGEQYHNDDERIPDGHRARPTAGPFDHCFTDLGGGPAPTITWPGFATLEVVSDASHLVVYTEPTSALCVEPQTGPPDACNLAEHQLVTRDHPLEIWMELRWRRESS